MNKQRKFDQKVNDELRHYVYGLKDPSNNEIFYIGVGENDRIFQHFNEVEGSVTNKNYFEDEETKNKKIKRIKKIWEKSDVDWVILSYGYNTQSEAMKTEAAIISTLWNHPGPNIITNKIQGQGSTYRSQSDILDMSAELINPNLSYKYVFLFPILNSIKNDLYDSTRGIWPHSNIIDSSLNNAYAVGINNKISKTSYQIANWTFLNEYSKYRFEAVNHPNIEFYEPLLNKNWTNVINAAKEYWGFGNYLIVEFDGKGKFRIIRGEKTKEWFNCL